MNIFSYSGHRPLEIGQNATGKLSNLVCDSPRLWSHGWVSDSMIQIQVKEYLENLLRHKNQ